jgi:hypothetical protein
MTAERELEPQPEKKPREMTFQESLEGAKTEKQKHDLARIKRFMVDLLGQHGFSDEQICSMKMESVVETLKDILIRDFDRLAAYAPSNPEFVTKVLEFATKFLEDKP